MQNKPLLHTCDMQINIWSMFMDVSGSISWWRNHVFYFSPYAIIINGGKKNALEIKWHMNRLMLSVLKKYYLKHNGGCLNVCTNWNNDTIWAEVTWCYPSSDVGWRRRSCIILSPEVRLLFSRHAGPPVSPRNHFNVLFTQSKHRKSALLI